MHHEGLSSVGLNPFHFSQTTSAYKNPTRCVIHNFIRSTNDFPHERFYSCNKLHATIYDFVRSVHLDTRQNPSRNELKCGDFGKYFFNQRIINRQARYSFRATSCTLRFTISRVACILMHDQTTHGTLFNPFWHSQFCVTSCTLRFYKKIQKLCVNHGKYQS